MVNLFSSICSVVSSILRESITSKYPKVIKNILTSSIAKLVQLNNGSILVWSQEGIRRITDSERLFIQVIL